MPLYALAAAGSLLWAAAFPFFRSGQRGTVSVDRRARWGVVLECAGYSLLWQGSFWLRSPAAWQVGLSVFLFAAASLLSWSAARALGRELRVDAALNAGHELIRSGPYRWVRHPIYTSMLCMLSATALLMTPLRLFIPALLLFLVGSEIRMHIEERLLASKFGEQFGDYRRSVPRWIPFLKMG